MAAELEEARAEAQQAKKQRQRAEQAVRALEEDVHQLKTQQRRTTDSNHTGDVRKEVEKYVINSTSIHSVFRPCIPPLGCPLPPTNQH